jgi:hypothetical protein
VPLCWVSYYYAGYHDTVYHIIIVILSVIMLSVLLLCRVSWSHVWFLCFSECHHAECRCVECRGANLNWPFSFHSFENKEHLEWWRWFTTCIFYLVIFAKFKYFKEMGSFTKLLMNFLQLLFWQGYLIKGMMLTFYVCFI